MTKQSWNWQVDGNSIIMIKDELSLTNHFGQHIQHVRKFESSIQNIIMKTMMMARGTNALFGLIKPPGE